MPKHLSSTKMRIPVLEIPELLLVPVVGAPSGSAPAGKLAMTTTGRLYCNPTVGDSWVASDASGDALVDFGVTATAAELNYLDNDDLVGADLQKLADLTASAAEINTLASSGVSNADLVKLAAITATDAEINTLASSGVSNADLVKLAAVTATDAEINTLASSGIDNADLVKLAAITVSAAIINGAASSLSKVDTSVITETDAVTTARAQLDSTGLNVWDGTNLTLSALETGAVTLGYGVNDKIALAAGVLTINANQLDVTGASNSGVTLNNATAVGLTITDAGTYGLSLGACETGSVGPLKFTPASGTPAATYGSAAIGAICMGADEKLYVMVTAGWVVVGSQA